MDLIYNHLGRGKHDYGSPPKLTSSKNDADINRRVGDYILGKTIGKGNFSKVKICHDFKTNKQYAMKIISLRSLRKENMEQQLRKEVTIMRMMNHPYVVKFEKVLQTKRNIYILMEYITGGELFSKIVQQKKVSEDVARRYFQQLILALEYCHTQGIAHRDLKPENLLLDSQDNLKISDFGLSTIAKTNAEVMITTVGTPQYVAPEIIKGDGYNGFKADIWSCGVILFVMLSGVLPFHGASKEELDEKIIQGRVVYKEYFSPDVKDLISRMLVINVTKRATINQIKAHRWFKAGLSKTLRELDDAMKKLQKKELQDKKAEAAAALAAASASSHATGNYDDFADHLEDIDEEGDEGNDAAQQQVVSVEKGITVKKSSAINGTPTKTGKKEQSYNAIELASFLMTNAVSDVLTCRVPSLVSQPTKFLLQLSSHTLRSDLTEFLTNSNCNPRMMKDKKTIKCDWTANSGEIVVFTVTLYPVISDFVLFVFSCLQGNLLVSYEIYRRIEAHYDEYMVSKPVQDLIQKLDEDIAVVTHLPKIKVDGQSGGKNRGSLGNEDLSVDSFA